MGEFVQTFPFGLFDIAWVVVATVAVAVLVFLATAAGFVYLEWAHGYKASYNVGVVVKSVFVGLYYAFLILTWPLWVLLGLWLLGMVFSHPGAVLLAVGIVVAGVGVLIAGAAGKVSAIVRGRRGSHNARTGDEAISVCQDAGDVEYAELLQRLHTASGDRSAALESFFDNAPADMTADEKYLGWIAQAGPQWRQQSAQLEIDTIALAWKEHITIDPIWNPTMIPHWEERRLKLQREREQRERDASEDWT